MPDNTDVPKLILTILRAAAIDTSKSEKTRQWDCARTIRRLINLFRLACRWLDDLRGMVFSSFKFKFVKREYAHPGRDKNQTLNGGGVLNRKGPARFGAYTRGLANTIY